MRQAAALRPIDQVRPAKFLAVAMLLAVAINLFVLLLHGPIWASRCCTAAAVFLASFCVLTRISMLPSEERLTWFWAALGMFIWGVGHATETFVNHSMAASNLTVDASDFIYVASIFPILLAFSGTREIQSLRIVFLLNCIQIALACPLVYILLYRMALSPAAAAVIMGRIYGASCALLAVMSLLRGLSWSTAEERCSVRWISIFLWIYLPIEVGMDTATRYWHLRGGTLLDLLWSAPFVLTSWKTITIPVDRSLRRHGASLSRLRLLVEGICPMLINLGILTLAAAVIDQHLFIGLSVIFTLFIIQGIQAAVVQSNYLEGRELLLDREHELKSANRALQELSLLDPLTGISNRRHFDAELEAAWKLAAPRRQPLSLLMIDLDYFKGVNDQHGHSYGDECLETVARMMTLQVRRPNDLVARLGGEEFAFLLPDTDAAGASAVAAKLHEAIRGRLIANNASPFERLLTVSIGVATVEPSIAADPASLIDSADRALYQAKTDGRNCTRIETSRKS